jgi:hypothetical protein
MGYVSGVRMWYRGGYRYRFRWGKVVIKVDSLLLFSEGEFDTSTGKGVAVSLGLRSIHLRSLKVNFSAD